MPLRAIFEARGMLWVTAALTAAYVFAIALFVYTSGGDPSFRLDTLGFAEALFSTPLLIACGLAIWLDNVQARRTFVGFAVGYILYSLDIFHLTFTGEHDAQYQLLLFQIPLIGFPALLIVGVIAGLFGRAPRR